MSAVHAVFRQCVLAMRKGALLTGESARDKEFHFQDWFGSRLREAGIEFTMPGRISYPDFVLPGSKEGFELKGLASPGRTRTFDCNSRMPSGEHEGMEMHYVFGRYPKDRSIRGYPLLDLVICHGSFLNSDHSLVTGNRSRKGFGSYGDVLVRHRKMYVVPTPFSVVEGLESNFTLILPGRDKAVKGFAHVGTLVRNELAGPGRAKKARAGGRRTFEAYALKPARGRSVAMRHQP